MFVVAGLAREQSRGLGAAASTGEQQPRAATGELFGDRETETSVGAGDQHGLAIESARRRAA